METKKFDRRPFTVNAVQLDQANAEDVAKWCGGVLGTANYRMLGVHAELPIVTIQGTGTESGKTFIAYLGMWIVQRKKSFRVYKHNTFNAIFVEQGIQLDPTKQSEKEIWVSSTPKDEAIRMHGFHATKPQGHFVTAAPVPSNSESFGGELETTAVMTAIKDEPPKSEWYQVINEASDQYQWVGKRVTDDIGSDLIRLHFNLGGEHQADQEHSYLPDELEPYTMSS